MYQYSRKVNNYYIYSVRLDDGKPVETYHSDTCLDVTGYSSREITEAPYLWINMVIEDDRHLVLNHLEKVLSGSPPQTFEHRITHKDGTVHWVENSIVPRTDSNGELISYYGVVRDITARKNGKKELFHIAANEKRLDKRITNINNCWVKINNSGNINIENVSIGGICLSTSQYMSVNSKHSIGLFCNNNEQIASSSEVAWSGLIETENRKSIPYYQVGLKFVEMKYSTKISLMKFISSINFTQVL